MNIDQLKVLLKQALAGQKPDRTIDVCLASGDRITGMFAGSDDNGFIKLTDDGKQYFIDAKQIAYVRTPTPKQEEK